MAGQLRYTNEYANALHLACTQGSRSFEIPDTVILERGKIAAWYYYSTPEGCIKAKHKSKLFMGAVEESFKSASRNQKRSSIIATFYETRDDRLHMTNRCVAFLDYENFGAFLYRGKGEMTGILQKFIGQKGDKNFVVQCCVRESRISDVKRVENYHLLEDFMLDPYDRCVTYEQGPRIQNCQSSIISAQGTLDRLRRIQEYTSKLLTDSGADKNGGNFDFIFKVDVRKALSLVNLYPVEVVVATPVTPRSRERRNSLRRSMRSSHAERGSSSPPDMFSTNLAAATMSPNASPKAAVVPSALVIPDAVKQYDMWAPVDGASPILLPIGARSASKKKKKTEPSQQGISHDMGKSRATSASKLSRLGSPTTPSSNTPSWLDCRLDSADDGFYRPGYMCASNFMQKDTFSHLIDSLEFPGLKQLETSPYGEIQVAHDAQSRPQTKKVKAGEVVHQRRMETPTTSSGPRKGGKVYGPFYREPLKIPVKGKDKTFVPDTQIDLGLLKPKELALEEYYLDGSKIDLEENAKLSKESGEVVVYMPAQEHWDERGAPLDHPRTVSSRGPRSPFISNPQMSPSPTEKEVKVRRDGERSEQKHISWLQSFQENRSKERDEKNTTENFLSSVNYMQNAEVSPRNDSDLFSETPVEVAPPMERRLSSKMVRIISDRNLVDDTSDAKLQEGSHESSSTLSTAVHESDATSQIERIPEVQNIIASSGSPEKPRSREERKSGRLSASGSLAAKVTGEDEEKRLSSWQVHDLALAALDEQKDGERRSRISFAKEMEAINQSDITQIKETRDSLKRTATPMAQLLEGRKSATGRSSLSPLSGRKSQGVSSVYGVETCSSSEPTRPSIVVDASAPLARPSEMFARPSALVSQSASRPSASTPSAMPEQEQERALSERSDVSAANERRSALEQVLPVGGDGDNQAQCPSAVASTYMPPPEPLAPPTAELDTLGKEEGVDQADTSTCSELLNEDASRAVAPTQTQEDAAPSCDEVVSEVIEVAPVVKSSSKCALQYTSQKEEPGKARDMEAARGDIAEQDIYEHSIPIDAVDKVFDMVEKYDVALGVAALDMPSVCVPEMTKHRATPDEFVAISADDSTASAADHGAVDDSRLHVAFDAIERTLTASPRGGHAEIKGGDDLIDQVQPPVTGAKTSGPAEKEVEMDPTVKGDIRTKNDDSVTEEGLQDPEPTENIVGTMIGSPPTTVIQSPVPTVEAPADSSTRVEAVPNVTEGGEGVEEAKNGNLLEVCSGKLFNAQYAEAESLLKEMLQSSDYDTASVLSLAGIMCIATGEYEPAEPLFVSAIDLLSKEGSEQNSVTSARAWVHLGEAYRCLCKNVSATKCIRKAEEILGPLEDCCSRERIELEVEVVGLQMRNAFDFCHIKTSLMLCAKAFELTTKHLPHDSHLKASATLALGVKALEKGHWEGAMHLIKPAHDYRLAHFTADHPAIAESTLMLGRYYIGTGQYAQAIDAITGAIEAMQRKFRNHPLLARLLYAIAEAHRLQGNMTSSARRHQQAFDMRQHIYKTSAHTEVVQSMCGIGLIKMGCGNYREAVDWLEKSLELRKEVMDAMVIKEHLEYDMHRVWLTHAKMTCSMNFSLRDVDMKLMKDSYGPSHQDLIDALMTVAYCLMYKGKFTDADKVLDKVLAMSQMVYGEKHPMMAAILHAKAENKRLPGNFDEAAALSTDSLNMRVDTLGRDSLWVVMSLLQRAFLLLDMGDALGAGEVSANVIKMITVRIDKDNALYGRALGLMGECCRQMEQYDSAERYLSSSLRILENLLGNKHVHTVEVLVCHAMLLMDSENEDKLLNAKLSLEKCSEWTREILGDSHPLNAFIDANHGMCVNALTTFYTKERDMAKLEKMLDRKSAWLASVRQDADFTLESVARSAPLPGEDDISQAMRYLQTYPFGSFNPRHYWRERFGDVDKDSQACIVPQAANASETLRDESGQELTSKVEAEAVQSPFQAFLSSNPTVDELAAARRGSVKDRYEVVSGKLNLKGRRTKPVKPPKPHHLVDDALLTKQQSRRQSAFSNLLMQRSGSVRVVEGGMNDEKKESSDNTNAKESGLNGIEREASEVLEPSQQSAPPDDKDKEEGIKEPVAAPPACDKEQSTRNLEIMQTTDVVEVAQEKPPQCEHAETSFAKPMDADTGDGGLVRRLSKMFGERGGSKAGSRRGSADAGTPAGTPAGPPDAVRRMSGLIVAHHSGALADLADAGSDTTAAPPQPAPQPAPDDQAPDDPAPQSAPDEPADSQTTHSSEPDSGMRTVPTETSGVHKNSATSSRKTSRDFTSRPLQGQAEDKSAHGQAEDTSGEGKSGENARRSSLQRISTSFLNHIDLVSPRVSPRQE